MQAVADTLFRAEAIETIPKFPYLFGAYAAIFTILFVYLVSIHTRQRRVERELRSLTSSEEGRRRR